MTDFKLITGYSPRGDQPQAIEALCTGLRQRRTHQVLLGVTGSGKTFTMANVIARLERPTLIIAPNKTLAAQLYNEFKGLFPENAVEYFVSYYDYYQPEAYIPSTDTYIQKDSSINEMIDKLRHSATRSVLSRRDVLVVASVSCIFGLGAPEDYLGMRVELKQNSALVRDRLLYDLVGMHYERNDVDFHRGVFRVRGDRVEIFPAYEEDRAIRVEFFGDEVDGIAEIDPLRGTVLQRLDAATIFPASHYVTRAATLKRAMAAIMEELKERVDYFRDASLLLEAQRIEERTLYDLEMMQELGYCSGIENYSRHLTGRDAGQPPPTLLDYFPEDFLLFIDESHITVPQLNGMYRGDRSRKQTLVTHGFRLPSALDNRPLQFSEFARRVGQTIYVSATPASYELEKAKEAVVEQIVRPTGLLDPSIQVLSARNQVDDLYTQILQRVEKGGKVLVTTLTKRMAEDLTEHYTDLGLRVQYLHADVSTLERMEIIRDLRLNKFDTLVGINLLREGLDIPEVSLVAILDADKEGFLRSVRSLIQTFGRAARNVNGQVILYGDTITRSMQQAMEESARRREIQEAYNQKHDIVPETIQKRISTGFEALYETAADAPAQIAESAVSFEDLGSIDSTIKALTAEMEAASQDLEFERAAKLRDRIRELRKIVVFS